MRDAKVTSKDLQLVGKLEQVRWVSTRGMKKNVNYKDHGELSTTWVNSSSIHWIKSNTSNHFISKLLKHKLFSAKCIRKTYFLASMTNWNVFLHICVRIGWFTWHAKLMFFNVQYWPILEVRGWKNLFSVINKTFSSVWRLTFGKMNDSLHFATFCCFYHILPLYLLKL